VYADEVLAEKFVAPPYTAVSEWTPNDNPAVVKVPLPLESVAVPRVVFPSLKVTVPAGIPVPGATTVTVAVKTTDWPVMDGFGVVVSAVVVGGVLTVCDTTSEGLPANVVLPP
jgi:hypothetical protein